MRHNGNKCADGTANPGKTPPVLVAADGSLLPFTLPLGYTSTYNSYYSVKEMTEMINSLSDPLTGAGIELYLILQYRGSKMINMSYRRSEWVEVGPYALTKNYDLPKGGNLIFYTASRLGNGGSKYGPEYVIKADQLNAFKNHVDYYTKAADLVYMQGTPSKGMIQMMSGDRVSGLLNLWGDALKSPEYWSYLISSFVTFPTNSSVLIAAEEAIPASKSVTKSTLELSQKMHAE